jgi:putative copper export protein
VELAAIARIVLRVVHAVAAMVWLGGGLYYMLAVRPLRRRSGPEALDMAQRAQEGFRRWSTAATALLVGSGVALMFDRLADGRGTAGYVTLLAVKVVAGGVALWLAGSLRPRRAGRARSARWAFGSGWVILVLGTIAYVLGVLLSVLYPPDPGAGFR